MLPVTDTRPSAPSLGQDRPTLVLSHSFGSSRREWTEVAALLADQYRTVTIDVPGFGEARNVPGYTVAEMVQQFAQTIVELGLDRYMLVGHSMTGKVMSILASQLGKSQFGLKYVPEKLVLLTSTPLGEEPLSDDARNELLSQPRNQQNADSFIASHSSIPLTPAVHARTVEDYFMVNPDAWTAWVSRGTREDWVDRAAPITTETLVIAAGQDREWGPDMQKRMTMPHLELGSLVVVEKSGHMVPMEAPEQLAVILREFAASGTSFSNLKSAA